jgi:hypothetical protein
VTTPTLDPRDTSSRTHRLGGGLAHIALADDDGCPVIGRALYGYRVSGTAVAIGHRQLCVVCEDLAQGDWHEP